jgi:hypothetical protein
VLVVSMLSSESSVSVCCINVRNGIEEKSKNP